MVSVVVIELFGPNWNCSVGAEPEIDELRVPRLFAFAAVPKLVSDAADVTPFLGKKALQV